ncbi:hypothetical protein [Bacillus velezensis]|uniref:hypothetical protein n=1 Tax=Bacillus velezensis TaxID=492670 RepID=UPI0021E8E172|nr:hypothetical protein [Bacillus velezensis]MCV3201493.1 hypothetical protein [Bacillus velezensis]
MKVKQLIDSLQEMIDKGEITEETQVLLNTYDDHDRMYQVHSAERLGEYVQIEANIKHVLYFKER